MPSEHMPAVEGALSALVAEIDAGRIEVYQNVLGHPYVIFKVPERPQGVFWLSHQDVRGWLTEFAWEGGHGLLRERDIDRILTFLRGRAMRKRLPEISDPALLRLLRSEPTLAVAYDFMYEQETGSHESTMAALWTTWRERAVERGLLTIGRRRFPGGPHVLSRVLNYFKDALSAIGITVEIKRSNGSQVTLT